MKAGSAPPKVPVAVKCACGKSIVLEPRWVGKPTGCAGCGRDFTVRMLIDPQTRRWTPTVTYTPVVIPTKIRMGQDGSPEWVNVACECGHKIGLDRRFLGKNMSCTACGREFIVRMMQKRGGKDTAVLHYSKGAPAPDKKASAEVAERAVEKEKPRAEGRKADGRAGDAKDIPTPPKEMHLLCVCGEELVVEEHFYNAQMFCAGCGALMKMRLIFIPDRKKYELEARIVEAPSQ